MDTGLSEKDLQEIKEQALRRFLDSHTEPNRDNNFLAECYIDAFLSYTKSQNWKVVNGQIQKKK